MLTSAQIRAARGLLGWSQTRLATEANLGIATVQRMEKSDGALRGNAGNVWKLQKALETAGIEFINANEGGVGVRFKTS